MLSEIIKVVMSKSVAKDIVKMSVKNSNRDDSVVKEKLGYSSIDEFMRADIKILHEKRS